MYFSKYKKKVAAVMAITMVFTSALPSFTWADMGGIQVRGTDVEHASHELKASPSVPRSRTGLGENLTLDEGNSYRKATPSEALIDAVKSFNSEVEFVDKEGRVLKDEDLNIPEYENSFPYLSQGAGRTKGNIDLDEYKYVEKEYFIKGNANVYDLVDGKLATKSNADYVNRIIVFQPESPNGFNGAVYVDILNASGKVDVPDIWRRSYDYFMKQGYIYVGITSKDVNVAALKMFDSNRYNALNWTVNGKMENGLIWDMLGQLGTLLKQESSPILYGKDYNGNVWNYLIGQSQSGFYLNTFVNNFEPANFIHDDLDEIADVGDITGENHIYDGYFNVVGGMTNASIATAQNDSVVRGEPVKPSAVPFMLVVGENDYSPSPVRADSDELGDLYRHYVFAGGSHSSKVFLPDPLDEIQLRAGRPAGDFTNFKPDVETGKYHTASNLNMDVLVNGALDNLHHWASGGKVAPNGPSSDEIEGSLSGGTFKVARDEDGNMISGIRSPQITVPVASYYGGANDVFNTNGGSMIYFDDEVLEERYTDRDNYLQLYEVALDEFIGEGWMVYSDKELMMSLAENEPIFDHPVKDKDAIEGFMISAPTKENLEVKTGTADGISYKETKYLMSGETNMYGLLRENMVYLRRFRSMNYVNYAKVCIPENFNGSVVIDLVFGLEGSKDISDYMKDGIAHIEITADPKAAKEKGGNWEIPFKTNEPRTESGLVWDIISQTITSIKQTDGILGEDGTKVTSITLGVDRNEANMAYTYKTVFKSFDAYGVNHIVEGKKVRTIALNDIDTEIFPKDPENPISTDVLVNAAKSFNEPLEFLDKDGKILQGEKLNIPETETSFPYLSHGEGRTKGNINLNQYGYVEEEYFISGNSNIYDLVSDELVTKGNADYVNRVIIFKPEKAEDFKGAIYVDILNASAKADVPAVWRRSYDFFMEQGYIYVGITSKDSMAESLKSFDPDRYGILNWYNGDKTENGLIWDMLGQLGVLLKQDASPLLYGSAYTEPVWSYLMGQSQSGFYLNTFVNNFDSINYIAEDVKNMADVDTLKEGRHIFDGYFNSVGGMNNAAISTNQSDKSKGSKPVKETVVPYILLVGENDYGPAWVRDDANEADNKYRHYLITGGAHGIKYALPDPLDEMMVKAGRTISDYASYKLDKVTGRPYTNTNLDMNVFVSAALENIHLWASQDIEAPHGPAISEIKGLSDRDEYGNMTTGIRSPQITVPVASYYGGLDGKFSTDGGSMLYLGEEILKTLYRNREDYLEKYEAALDEMIDQRWILKSDKDHMMELAKNEPIFGNPGKDKTAIEASMGLIPEKEILSEKTEQVQGVSYQETEYRIKGFANIYGILFDNVLYQRRMESLSYTNYARVCVPENFSGDVIIDLMFENEELKDVTEYMRNGKAYIGITASPEAAKEKHGSWEIPHTPGKPRAESGLVWDIISQTVSAVKDTKGLLATRQRSLPVITLGVDENEADMVYTYQLMFGSFDTYGVRYATVGSNPSIMSLNSIDKEVLPKKPFQPEEKPEKNTGGSSSRSSTAKTNEWKQNDKGWWIERPDGTWPASQWMQLSWNGISNWYYFDAEGYMVTGWVEYEGNKYYLHATSDGNMGHMYTEWHLIDEKWYYFNAESDGVEGCLLISTTTPDGYQVDANGVYLKK